MPEIKKTFIKGRMNKDLDERLIPNGEYQDAMNIQVSTSDDADIGAVQNIVGNVLFNGFGVIGANFKCVGSIADEKNNKLYWFITNGSTTDAIVEYNSALNDDIIPVIVDTKADTDDAVLKFTGDIITGINIIDDLLFWTDNNSEPKKINIKSFLNNQHTDLQTHSKFFKKDKPALQDILVQADGSANLTTTLVVKGINSDLDIGDELLSINGNDPNNIGNKITDIDINSLTITLESNEDFVDGDIIVFANSIDVEERDITVIKTRPTKAPVINIHTTDNEDDTIIFEKIFPRFSYRYKYVDGEYSPFGPFTDVVFSPKSFNFPVKEPYNEGMANKITSIEIMDFVAPDIPKDVVEIDILYKEEGSTVVYLIDSLKPTNPKLLDGGNNNNWTTNGSEVNSGYKGSYTINSESIYSAIPSNQLLRPWDNVPRKALAQEITSNRLVYANYLQGYDLGIGSSGEEIRPRITVDYKDRTVQSLYDANETDFSNGLESIKSLRDYQLGVVYGDKYGRETPVFTSSEASINIPWTKSPAEFNASKTNQLIAKLKSYTPDWAEYYKVFIKETTNEYYNLIMDKVYKAEEEGNIWMSFPSSDRNKINEDDFLILKKSVDGGNLQVDTKNKFKIIDIKNEAPEAIKFIYEPIGEAGGTLVILESIFTETNLTLSGNDADSFPGTATKKFSIDAGAWIANGGMKLDDSFNKEQDLYFSFYKVSGNGFQFSERYKVTQVFSTTAESDTDYTVHLDKAITIADSWCNDGSADDFLEPTMRIRFEKKVYRNLEEVSGRFFVKIASNSISERYIEQSLSYDGDLDYSVYGEPIPAYWFADIRADSAAAPSSGIVNTTTSITMPTDNVYDINLNKNRSHLKSAWDNIATEVASFALPNHGDEGRTWIIDSLYMAAAQEGWPFDAGQSGRMWNGGGADAGTDGVDVVDGLEGIVSITDDHASVKANGDIGDGPRRWKVSSSHLNNTLDSTYSGIRDQDRYYLHLTFLKPGQDLFEGDYITGGVAGYPATWYNHSYYAAEGTGTGELSSFPNLQNIRNTMEWQQGVSSSGVTIPNEDFSGSHTQINMGNESRWGWDYQDKEKVENQWNPGFHSEENKKIVSQLFIGNRFKFKNDPQNTVYTIKNTPKIKRLYNHTSWNMVYEWDGIAGGNGLQEKTSSDSDVDASVERAARDWAIGGFQAGSLQAGDLTFGNNYNKKKLWDTIKNFGSANNRRVCYILELDKDPTDSSQNGGSYNPIDGVGGGGDPATADYNSGANIQFLTPQVESSGDLVSNDPAIWETDPQTKDGLDIYYEASQAYPFKLTYENRELFAPVGCRVTIENSSALSGGIQITEPIFLTSWDNSDIGDFTISPGFNYADINGSEIDYSNAYIKFWRKDKSYTTGKISPMAMLNVTGQDYKIHFTLDTTIDPGYNEVGLSWYNCISFGNGCESDRIRDDFNLPQLSNGVKASTTLDALYNEEHRKNGLIYSGIYNSTSRINNLNQFIQAENITKDLNPTYGSIQRLFQRRIDLVSFCEDKVVKVTAGKDVLYNAKGDPQLIASNKVLGDATPFVGDYGISTDPASFASESYRAYFTDRQRGAVLRLSMDGLTPISEVGMSKFFKDSLPSAGKIIGSYDLKKKDYNLTLNEFIGANHLTNSDVEEGEALTTQTISELLLNPDFTGGTSLSVGAPIAGLLNGTLDTTFTTTSNPNVLTDISSSPHQYINDNFGTAVKFILFPAGAYDGTVDASGYYDPMTTTIYDPQDYSTSTGIQGGPKGVDNNGDIDINISAGMHDIFGQGIIPYTRANIGADTGPNYANARTVCKSNAGGNYNPGGVMGGGGVQTVSLQDGDDGFGVYGVGAYEGSYSPGPLTHRMGDEEFAGASPNETVNTAHNLRSIETATPATGVYANFQSGINGGVINYGINNLADASQYWNGYPTNDQAAVNTDYAIHPLTWQWDTTVFPYQAGDTTGLYCSNWKKPNLTTHPSEMFTSFCELQPHLTDVGYGGRPEDDDLVLHPNEKIKFSFTWEPTTAGVSSQGVHLGIFDKSLNNGPNATVLADGAFYGTNGSGSRTNYIEYENLTGAPLNELSFAWSPKTELRQSFLITDIVIEKTMEYLPAADTYTYFCDDWDIDSSTGRTTGGGWSFIGSGGVPGDSPTNKAEKDVSVGADSMVQDHGVTFLEDAHQYEFNLNTCFGFIQDELIIKNTGNSPDPAITIDTLANTGTVMWTQSGDSNKLEIEAIDGSTGTIDNMELLDITDPTTGGDVDYWTHSPSYSTYLNNYYDTPRTYWEGGKVVFDTDMDPATSATRIIQNFSTTNPIPLPPTVDGYELSFEVSEYTEGTLGGFIYGEDDGTGTANGFVIPNVTADGTYTHSFNFDGTSNTTTTSGSMNKLVFKVESAPIYLKLDNVSLKDKTIYYLDGSVNGWTFSGFDQTTQNNIYWDTGTVKFDNANTGDRLKQAVVGSSFVEGNTYGVKLNVSNYTGSGSLTGYYYNNVGKGFKFSPIDQNGNYTFNVTVGDISTTDANLFNLFYIEVASTANFSGNLDNITLQRVFISNFPTTITYSEDVKGWVSFKSFVPESGVSLAGNYFTFDKGLLYKHHASTTRNTFYNNPNSSSIFNFEPSTVTAIFNSEPSSIKDFKTISYEGTQSKVVKNLDDAVTGSYYNLNDIDGWYVEEIITDKQQGTLNEFIEKEGKWFNHIKGDETIIDIAAFNFQGIGMITDVTDITPQEE